MAKIPSAMQRCMASKPSRGGFARVHRPTGWAGGYKRLPPKGEHKCLSPREMAALLATME